ncbi:MAG TPA: glycosyltransferase family A protein [Thermoanaerobaculia bacterium]|nr:glycosyltransferase family A protein [Thermoanaerobaculia bacterium]
MDTPPAVSCFCLTYGRPRLLEEAVHSFLQQDYAGPKEMIVLNDYAGQVLELDHPEVQVINLPKRFRTAGEKMNAAAALASHDLLFVWDDDDVYLPHRLSYSVANFDPAKGFFKAHQAWFWSDGRLNGTLENIFHAGSCWSRSLFDAVGGYAADGCGYDLLFEQQLESRFPGSTAARRVEPEELYYVYRWGGTGSYHLSGFGALEAGQNVGYAQAAAAVENQARRGEIPVGRVVLQPHWKHDYPQLIADHLAARRAADAITFC